MNLVRGAAREAKVDKLTEGFSKVKGGVVDAAEKTKAGVEEAGSKIKEGVLYVGSKTKEGVVSSVNSLTNWATEQAGIVGDTVVEGADDISQQTMTEVENMVASTGLVNPPSHGEAPPQNVGPRREPASFTSVSRKSDFSQGEGAVEPPAVEEGNFSPEEGAVEQRGDEGDFSQGEGAVEQGGDEGGEGAIEQGGDEGDISQGDGAAEPGSDE
ncbi:gamma-synuclein-like isoform X1 [Brienomyrus brachyistius]|uniref:gamma-synuclein-like isoform X1 n=1 Tax=Brienomyrus brachyistius TaxID=42636 RepID=UPI0020B30AC2|nr:gamma-synuclein-like isoform X1 [Brienomyrus brachyistius]